MADKEDDGRLVQFLAIAEEWREFEEDAEMLGTTPNEIARRRCFAQTLPMAAILGADERRALAIGRSRLR